jgi:hypothetical protein
VRRGDHHGPRGGPAQRVHDQTLAVDGDRVDPAPVAEQAVPGHRVAGLLDGDPIPRQHADQQVDGVAEARADHDPARVRVDAADPPEVLREGRAQRR